MRIKEIFSSLIFILLIFFVSCEDPIDNIQSESGFVDIDSKGVNPSMQFFHNKEFRGFNINPWTYNPELDEILEKTGANIFRLSFTGGAVLMKKTDSSGSTTNPDGVFAFNEVGFSALNRVLNWAETNNVKIIIDPHTVPGFESDYTTSPEDDFWKDPRWRKHLIKLWVEIIDRVGNRGDVIAGYDLLNEPQIPDPNICIYGNQWNEMVEILVDTIRKKGDFHPIIVQPAGIAIGYNCNSSGGSYTLLSRWDALNQLELPNDNNLVVSVHNYTPLEFTHQGVQSYWPAGVRYPSSAWDFNRMNNQLQLLRNYKPHVPKLIGEFSVSRAAGPDGDVFLNDFLKMVEAEGWSWVYHAWDKPSNEWHPEHHYTDSYPFSNEPAPSGSDIKTAPRLNLLRQYMYKNYSNFPPSDEMIHGLYRLHHPINGDQILTYYFSEVSTAVVSYGYKISGVYARVAKDTSNNPNLVPVYRLRNPITKDRLFTTSEYERNIAVRNSGYQYESIGFYASLSNSSNYVPVYRLQKGALHSYAFDSDQVIELTSDGWSLEADRTFYCQPNKMF